MLSVRRLCARRSGAARGGRDPAVTGSSRTGAVRPAVAADDAGMLAVSLALSAAAALPQQPPVDLQVPRADAPPSAGPVPRATTSKRATGS